MKLPDISQIDNFPAGALVEIAEEDRGTPLADIAERWNDAIIKLRDAQLRFLTAIADTKIAVAEVRAIATLFERAISGKPTLQ